MKERTSTPEVGPLQGPIHLPLHTRHAENLVEGRRGENGKKPITGLLSFAGQLKPLWAGAALGDPYAEWWLIKIIDQIKVCKAAVENLQKTADELMSSLDGLEIEIAESTSPKNVELKFGNPLAYQVAFILASYDKATRTTLTLRHLGHSTDELGQEHYICGKLMRRTLASATGYKYFGLDRKAIQQGTKRAQEAQAALGKLPADVATGERRPEICPRISTD